MPYMVFLKDIYKKVDLSLYNFIGFIILIFKPVY